MVKKKILTDTEILYVCEKCKSQYSYEETARLCCTNIGGCGKSQPLMRYLLMLVVKQLLMADFIFVVVVNEKNKMLGEAQTRMWGSNIMVLKNVSYVDASSLPVEKQKELGVSEGLVAIETHVIDKPPSLKNEGIDCPHCKAHEDKPRCIQAGYIYSRIEWLKSKLTSKDNIHYPYWYAIKLIDEAFEKVTKDKRLNDDESNSAKK